MDFNIKVWEIKLKVYILSEIPLSGIQSKISEFLDSVLIQRKDLKEFHNANRYKCYTFNSFYPLEKDKIYKKDHIYTVIIRTVDSELAKYFSETLRNHFTDTMKGLVSDLRILPKKVIGEIYTLTPAILKSDQGYWKNTMNLSQFEKSLIENIIKKYNQYMNEKIDENFQFYTNITFLNSAPIANEYKGIRLLGDKFNLQIADNQTAQELAYFMLGTGVLTMNSRGYGYCNYRWI